MIEFNENGVPQYPKGHTGRLLVTMAAIDRLGSEATVWTVANLTGLSKTKIDFYVAALNYQFGTNIVKDDRVFTIESWGGVLKRTGVKRALTKLVSDIA